MVANQNLVVMHVHHVVKHLHLQVVSNNTCIYMAVLNHTNVMYVCLYFKLINIKKSLLFLKYRFVQNPIHNFQIYADIKDPIQTVNHNLSVNYVVVHSNRQFHFQNTSKSIKTHTQTQQK